MGIVAEGWSDYYVLENILCGALGLHSLDIDPIRPARHEDETDRAARRSGQWRAAREAEFSNWEIVIEECRRRENIANYLDSPLDGERLVIVHLDTAECDKDHYDVVRPDRSAPTYASELRARVEARLTTLLGDALTPCVRCAIAIEETDAWVLAGLGHADTESLRDPKRRLHDTAEFREFKAPSGPEKYQKISKVLKKPKGLRAAGQRSVSLRLFLETLPERPTD